MMLEEKFEFYLKPFFPVIGFFIEDMGEFFFRVFVRKK